MGRAKKDKNKSTRGPERLSNILADLLVRRGYAQQVTSSQYQEAWARATDEPTSRASRPGHLRRGVLEIWVAHSTLTQELTFRKKNILKVLQQEIGPEVRDLRFRIGTVD